MKFFLAIIALAFPALELAGIYHIWQALGAWTLLWLAAAVVAGVAVLRRAQAEFLPGIMLAGFEGRSPFAALWHSGRQFLAGALLIFPGAISDAFALILLLWPTGAAPSQRQQRPGYGRAAANDDVIEGEWRRED